MIQNNTVSQTLFQNPSIHKSVAPILNNSSLRWEKITLEEVVTLQRGFDLPIGEREEGTFPVIGSNGIAGHHISFKVNGPGVLVGRSGSVGKVTWTSENYWPLNTTLWVKDFHGNDPKFIYYFLGYLDLGKYTEGVSVPTLNRNTIHPLIVCIPPLPQQRVIACILQTIQQAIQTRRKELELERERKAALMHYLFTHGTRNELTKQSEVGEIPERWEVLCLGDICTISTGTTPDTTNLSYYQGDIAFVKTSEIANNRIREAETRISKDAVTKYNLTKYPPGTVFMAMYGQGKTRGQVALLEIPATTSQNTAAIIPGENLQSDFLWQYLMSQYIRLRSTGAQGHISHLNLSYVKQYQIPIPPPEEQISLTEILDQCDSKITTLEKEITLHEELFRALLDELMTGRISTLPLVAQLEKETLTDGQRT